MQWVSTLQLSLAEIPLDLSRDFFNLGCFPIHIAEMIKLERWSLLLVDFSDFSVVCQPRVLPQNPVNIWRFPFHHGATPSHHPLMDFLQKPSSYWGTNMETYGTLKPPCTRPGKRLQKIMGQIGFLRGKSTLNGPFSIAMNGYEWPFLWFLIWLVVDVYPSEKIMELSSSVRMMKLNHLILCMFTI